MPVYFPKPTAADGPDAANNRLEELYELSSGRISSEMRQKLNTQNGLNELAILFFASQPLPEINNESLTSFYAEFLEKLNSNFTEVVNEHIATLLKIFIDLQKIGSDLSAIESYKSKILKKTIEKILDLEQKITEKLDKLITAETQKKETELREKFQQLSPTFTHCTQPFEGFPAKEIWRFYVDGNFQKIASQAGWIGYEKREPGCLAVLHNAFLYTLNNIEQELTVNLLETIHTMAISNIKQIPTGFRGKGTTINPRLYSLLGMHEYLQKQNNADNPQSYSKKSYTTGYGYCLKLSLSDLNGKISENFEKIVEVYNQKLKNANDNKFFLFKAIVHLSTDLVRLHPYLDGNARAFVNILINRELIKHGFPPVILDDPNAFDTLTYTELGLETLTGMENFRYVKENCLYPKADLTLNTEAFMKEAAIPIAQGFTHQPIPLYQVKPSPTVIHGTVYPQKLSDNNTRNNILDNSI